MGKNILIVDDDEDLIEATKVVLKSKGYDVSGAISKSDCLDKIGKESYDLIILDVMMDKMCDGFDLARELKSNDAYKDVPILMVSAIAKETGFSFSEEAGDREWLPVDVFLSKPIESEELLAQVKKLIS